MKFWFKSALILLLGCIPSLAAERINHAGRILGPQVVVTNATLFNTTNADVILSSLQIFPTTNAWNEDISNRPLLPNSDAMMAQISADLAAANRGLRAFYEMNFVLIPDSQPNVNINFVTYPGDSDPSPYPIPTNMPIETWPHDTGATTLTQWQQAWGGDRHGSIVQPGNGFIWETWQMQYTNSAWKAANGAKFDLKSNALRTPGYTSGDAAGLPMFPALPRFDEVERGVVEHACRIVVAKSRHEYIYPATHYASSTPASQTNVPAMGQRVRLKSTYVVTNSWTKQEKVVLAALKKYGAIVADNGSFFSISVTPDDRWPDGCFDHFKYVGLTNFEVIQATGPTEGPRSPGGPRVDAGSDRTAVVGNPVTLLGAATTSSPPSVINWKLYSGPNTNGVAFGNAAQTNSTATFSTPGVYTLMLSASNGVHTVAYDAVVVTVSPTNVIRLTGAPAGANLNLSWTGGTGPFVIQKTATLIPSWSNVLTTSQQNASIPITGANAYFRVKGN